MNGRPYSNVVKLMKDSGLRPTRQRLALARLLFESCENRHVTAEKLHQEALDSDVPVSLATVYNTLNQFMKSGLLREVVVESGRCYYDTNTDPHHHFYYEESGNLVDLERSKVKVEFLGQEPEDAAVESIDVVIRVRSKSV